MSSLLLLRGFEMVKGVGVGSTEREYQYEVGEENTFALGEVQ